MKTLILILIAMLMMPLYASASIVTTQGGYMSDSVAFNLKLGDSLGNPTTADSAFVLCVAGRGVAFRDSMTSANFAAGGISSQTIRGFTLYYFRRKVIDIDSNYGPGNYSIAVILKKNSPYFVTTTTHDFDVISSTTTLYAALDSAGLSAKRAQLAIDTVNAILDTLQLYDNAGRFPLKQTDTVNMAGQYTKIKDTTIVTLATAANLTKVIDTVNAILDTLQLYDNAGRFPLKPTDTVNMAGQYTKIKDSVIVTLATAANLTKVIDTVNAILDSLQLYDNAGRFPLKAGDTVSMTGQYTKIKDTVIAAMPAYATAANLTKVIDTVNALLDSLQNASSNLRGTATVSDATIGVIADSVAKHNISAISTAGSLAVYLKANTDTTNAILDSLQNSGSNLRGGGTATVSDAAMGAIADSVAKHNISAISTTGSLALYLRQVRDSVFASLDTLQTFVGMPDSLLASVTTIKAIRDTVNAILDTLQLYDNAGRFPLKQTDTVNMAGQYTKIKDTTIVTLATAANLTKVIDTVNALLDTLQLYDNAGRFPLKQVDTVNRAGQYTKQKDTIIAALPSYATAANLTKVIDTVNALLDSLQNAASNLRGGGTATVSDATIGVIADSVAKHNISAISTAGSLALYLRAHSDSINAVLDSLQNASSNLRGGGTATIPDSLLRAIGMLRQMAGLMGVDSSRQARFIDPRGDNSDGTTWKKAWTGFDKVADLTAPTDVFVSADSFANVACTLSTPGVAIIGKGPGQTRIVGNGTDRVFTVIARNCTIKGMKISAGLQGLVELDPGAWCNAIVGWHGADFLRVTGNVFDSLNYKPVCTGDTAWTKGRFSVTAGRTYGVWIDNNEFIGVQFIAIDVNGIAMKIFANNIRRVKATAGTGSCGIQLFTHARDCAIFGNILDTVRQYYAQQNDTGNFFFGNYEGTRWTGDGQGNIQNNGTRATTIRDFGYNEESSARPRFGILYNGDFEFGNSNMNLIPYPNEAGWRVDTSATATGLKHQLHSYYTARGKKSLYMKATVLNSYVWVTSDTMWADTGLLVLRGAFSATSGQTAYIEIHRYGVGADSCGDTLTGSGLTPLLQFGKSWYNTKAGKITVRMKVVGTGTAVEQFWDDISLTATAPSAPVMTIIDTLQNPSSNLRGGGTASVPDSLLHIVTLMAHAIDSINAVLDSIQNASSTMRASGSGTTGFAVTIALVDTSATVDTAVTLAPIVINNLAQNGTQYTANTDNTGKAHFQIPAGTWVVFTPRPGFAQNLDTFIVSGNTLDTLKLARGNGGRTTVIGFIQRPSGGGFDQPRITVEFVSNGNDLITVGDTLIGFNNSRPDTARFSSATGWWVDLYGDSLFNDADTATHDSTWYRFTITDRRYGRLIDRFNVVVPISDTPVYIQNLRRWER